MPPRRSHTKSRNGCRRCKARKIKCDEVHPRCGNCAKHGVPCDFDRPEIVLKELRYANAIPAAPARPPIILHRQPATALASLTTPARHRLLELRLMHHYTVATFSTINLSPTSCSVWKGDALRIALSGEHRHLIDAILAAAALHLRSLHPHDRDLYQASHAYIASSLADYSATLNKGINTSNAESLFLTSAMIGFQAVALRSLAPDGLSICEDGQGGGATAGYTVPTSWFHALQGVKIVTATSWRFLRDSPIILSLIRSHEGLNLDRSGNGFFGDLLHGLEDELSTMDRLKVSPTTSNFNNSGNVAASSPAQRPGVPPSVSSSVLRMLEEHSQAAGQPGEPPQVASTRQTYQHAVAVLDYAHKFPHKRVAITFPATVNRRFVELLEEGRPRALAILTCFFALLKTVQSSDIWWLRGMVQREVLGLVGLFKEGALGRDAYQRWRPHLEWAAKIALWEEGIPIPPEVWGSDWKVEERNPAEAGNGKDYVTRFERLSLRESPHDTDAPSPPAG